MELRGSDVPLAAVEPRWKVDPLHDVVIAGAGPAGSRIARDLALRGFDVVVLEEHESIGDPCHCSGLVTPRTLELAGVGEDLVHNTIRGAVIHAPPSRPVTVAGDRIHAYVIDRSELDRRLAEQARNAGATFLRKTRFLGFSLADSSGGRTADGAVVVRVLREGSQTTIRARLLVGADGAQSRVAQQVRGSAISRAVVGLGALAEYDGNAPHDHVELFLDPASAPGWFGWTIPVGDGMARLGTGSANGIKPRDSFERLRRSFPDSFGSARVHSHSGGLIALWEPTPMTSDRVMLVGDAARQVKPTSGGGIHAALHAAGLAAEVAAEAIQRGDMSARGLRAYPRRWHGSAGRELRRQHDMRRAFERLSASDLAILTQLLEDGVLRSAVNSAADIDYPSRMVAKLALHQPRLALKLLGWPRFPLAWLPGAA